MIEKPLNLPPGSVRAILAIAIVLGILLLSLLNKSIPDQLWTAGVMIIGFYFGTRATK